MVVMIMMNDDDVKTGHGGITIGRRRYLAGFGGSPITITPAMG